MYRQFRWIIKVWNDEKKTQNGFKAFICNCLHPLLFFCNPKEFLSHTQSYFVNWGEAEERKRTNTTLKRRDSPPRSTIFSCGMISNREFWLLDPVRRWYCKKTLDAVAAAETLGHTTSHLNVITRIEHHLKAETCTGCHEVFTASQLQCLCTQSTELHVLCWAWATSLC